MKKELYVLLSSSVIEWCLSVGLGLTPLLICIRLRHWIVTLPWHSIYMYHVEYKKTVSEGFNVLICSLI